MGWGAMAFGGLYSCWLRDSRAPGRPASRPKRERRPSGPEVARVLAVFRKPGASRQKRGTTFQKLGAVRQNRGTFSRNRGISPGNRGTAFPPLPECCTPLLKCCNSAGLRANRSPIHMLCELASPPLWPASCIPSVALRPADSGAHHTRPGSSKPCSRCAALQRRGASATQDHPGRA